jgi:surface polysaccharide O-acyltransferase-like enzyme
MRFAVPVFFMLSGMFFLDPQKKISIKTIFTKHIPRMLVPLVFWGVFYFYLERVVNGIPVGLKDLPGALYSLLSVDGFLILWFLYTLIGLYIASPVLRAVIKSSTKKQLEYFLLIGFLFTSLLPYLAYIPQLTFLSRLEFFLNLTMVSGYVLLFVLGYYLKTYSFSKHARMIVYALGIAGLLATILFTLIAHQNEEIPQNVFLEPYSPNIIFYSSAIFLLFKNLFSQRVFKEKTLKAVRFFTNESFGVYLIHYAFIFVFIKLGLSVASFSPVLSIPITTGLCFFGSVFVSWVLKKIPLLNRLA